MFFQMPLPDVSGAAFFFAVNTSIMPVSSPLLLMYCYQRRFAFNSLLLRIALQQ